MTDHTHGSGCVFSTALASFLAMDEDVATATKHAHEFTRSAIRRGYRCGQGSGAVNPVTVSRLDEGRLYIADETQNQD